MVDPDEPRVHDSGDGRLPHISNFTLFPDLPAELRIKIWIEAHPPPRNVPISVARFQRKESYAPPLLDPRSPFAHLLVNHEAREVFLQHYHLLFRGFPSAPASGRTTRWFFNYEKDSLCMASGLKSLRFFLARFPDDMKRIRYLDIAPDTHSLHGDGYFNWKNCTTSPRITPAEIYDLKDLRLVTVRTIRPYAGCPHPWIRVDSRSIKGTVEVLQNALRHEKDSECGGRCVRLAFRHEWVEDAWMANPYNSHYVMAHRAFLQAYDPVSAETRERWDEMGIEVWKEKIEVRGWGPPWPPPIRIVDVECKMAEVDLHGR